MSYLYINAEKDGYTPARIEPIQFYCPDITKSEEPQLNVKIHSIEHYIPTQIGENPMLLIVEVVDNDSNPIEGATVKAYIGPSDHSLGIEGSLREWKSKGQYALIFEEPKYPERIYWRTIQINATKEGFIPAVQTLLIPWMYVNVLGVERIIDRSTRSSIYGLSITVLLNDDFGNPVYGAKLVAFTNETYYNWYDDFKEQGQGIYILTQTSTFLSPPNYIIVEATMQGYYPTKSVQDISHYNMTVVPEFSSAILILLMILAPLAIFVRKKQKSS